MCIVRYVADFTFTASYVVTYLFVIPSHSALKMNGFYKTEHFERSGYGC